MLTEFQAACIKPHCRFDMAPSAGKGGVQRDDLSDFFDFSKPWVRKERIVPSAPRQVEVDPLSVPPPATSEEEEAAETEAEWQKYQVLAIHLGLQVVKILHQKAVLRRLMVQSQASCHGGSTFGGAATNSMSGIESDTFVETLSISPHWFETCSFQFNFFPSLFAAPRRTRKISSTALTSPRNVTRLGSCR